jgi:hypothetical protein
MLAPTGPGTCPPRRQRPACRASRSTAGPASGWPDPGTPYTAALSTTHSEQPMIVRIWRTQIERHAPANTGTSPTPGRCRCSVHYRDSRAPCSPHSGPSGRDHPLARARRRGPRRSGLTNLPPHIDRERLFWDTEVRGTPRAVPGIRARCVDRGDIGGADAWRRALTGQETSGSSVLLERPSSPLWIWMLSAVWKYIPGERSGHLAAGPPGCACRPD